MPTQKDFHKDLHKKEQTLQLVEADPFKLELSLEGNKLGFLAVGKNGYGVVSSEAALLAAVRIPASDKMYIKAVNIETKETGENWLSHWDISTDHLGVSTFGSAVAWKIKKVGTSSQLISDFSKQSLSIKKAGENDLYVRDDYSVLDVKIIR